MLFFFRKAKIEKFHRILDSQRKNKSEKTKYPYKRFYVSSWHFLEKNQSFPDIMIFLSMHAINRRHDHIDKALNVLRVTESDLSFLFRKREPMFSYMEDGLNLINPGRFQDLYMTERGFIDLMVV